MSVEAQLVKYHEIATGGMDLKLCTLLFASCDNRGKKWHVSMTPKMLVQPSNYLCVHQIRHETNGYPNNRDYIFQYSFYPYLPSFLPINCEIMNKTK